MTSSGDAVAKRTRSDTLARMVSIALHPFVVFAVLALIAAARSAPETLGRTAIGMVVAIAVVAAFIAQRMRGGHWATVDASSRSDRPLLYVVALVVTGGYWLWQGASESTSSSGVLLAMLMLMVAGVANRWIKLSLHLACLAFAAMLMLGLSQPVAVIAFALLPLLGWSRLRMRRHTLREVVGGMALGLVTGVIFFVTELTQVATFS